MELNIYKTDGTKSRKKVTLSDEIFAIEPNETLVYEDVRSFLSNKRQGTAKTKGRTEVRGGGRKAYRQKGTGNARRGSIRSPLLIGGGTVFGPKPRDYKVKLTKKMRVKARKSALTYKAQEEAIMIVEDFTLEEPKTKEMVNILSALKLTGKKVLLVLPHNNTNILKSGRNIPDLQILEAGKPSTYEIIHADYILINQESIPILEQSLGINAEEEAA